MKIKSIILNAIYLFFSHVVVRFLTAIATILVARYLDTTQYGLLSLAISFTIVTAFFTEIGLTHTLIREGTRPNSKMSELMGTYFLSRSTLGVITLIVSIIGIRCFYTMEQQAILLWAVVPSIIGSVFTGFGVSYFQVIQKMMFTAIIRAATGCFTALALFLGILFKVDLVVFSAIYGFSIVLGGALSFFLATRRIKMKFVLNKSILNGLGAFSFSAFVVMIFPQLGTITLERSSTLEEVGYFAAAYRIPSILYQIPNVLALAFYPMLFKLANTNSMKEKQILNVAQIKFMSSLSILISLPFIFYSEWWIQLLLGTQWTKAAPVLSILSFLVVFQAVSSPLSDGLATEGLHKRRSTFQLFVLFFAFVFYVLIGRHYGAVGAAVVALLVEIVNLCGLVLLKPDGFRIFISGTRGPGIALLIAITVGALLRYVNIFPVISILAISFIFILILCVIDEQLKYEVKSRLSKQGHKKSILVDKN
ncbi:oligosaccharide flippase family protein [Paenibacillus sp. D51F]